MPRPATGRLEQRTTSQGVSYIARFSAFGRRWKIKLGDSSGGMTAASAEHAMQAILADVRRGRWLPEREEQQRPVEATQSFHELASGWLDGRRALGEADLAVWELNADAPELAGKCVPG